MKGGELRCWDEPLPDALRLIFKKLSLPDILTVIPRINIEDWSRLQLQDKINQIVEMLSTIICGSVYKFGDTVLSNEGILSFIANNSEFLEELRLVMRPLEVVYKDSQDDEAHAIITTMPKMKNLEMVYLVLYIDLRGYGDVKLNENYTSSWTGCRQRELLDDCVYYSDSSDYLAWGFVTTT
ncbi:hypothetical protein MKW98_013914 [Papaver atlanticum]|uniref:Uncharacterized protein n=1 Tax=Papaver atlanticum TaxID=357466 RepID=A0AAD4SGA2_9MAGN|nr:hypothetical protein MKW98_013914 [Papaver atlanticum]